MVGIVAVNWNGWQDTLEWLRSIHSLNYPRFGVVVVDNGSTDGSEDRLRRASPQLTVLQTACNLGYPGGANVGIRFFLDQNADFVWLVNNDTVVDENALTNLVDHAEADPQVGLWGSSVYQYGRPEKIQFRGGGRFRIVTGATRYVTRADEGRLDYVSGASLLVRRAVFERVGLLNERLVFYWDDVDFSIRARRAGWRLGVAEGSIVYHKEGHTVGHKSPRSDFLETESLTVFLFESYGGLGAIPLAIRLAGKVVNRMLRRQPNHIVHVGRGLVAGLRRLTRPIVGMQ